jgi:effector-binding domain-containing protein
MPLRPERQGRHNFIIGLMRTLAAAAVMSLAQSSSIAQMPTPEPLQPIEVFAEEVILPAKTILFVTGKATWDNAYATLTGSFKSIASVHEKQKLQPTGLAMTIYTAVDNSGFSYQAAVPIAAAPADFPRGAVAIGQSPAGKALKFVYRGSFDAMDMLYESITHYIDEKRIERQGLFIEEYVTDPVTAPEDKLVVNVFVLVK